MQTADSSQANEGIIVLKNALNGVQRGPIQNLERIVNGSDENAWTPFLLSEQARLEAMYPPTPKEVDFSGKVSMALVEALTNFQLHANKGDPTKRIYVTRWHDDTRIYYCIKGSGEGFDPRNVRVSTLNPDGSVFESVERTVGRHKGKGGWGHILMYGASDFLAYDEEGKSMYLFFELPKARAA